MLPASAVLAGATTADPILDLIAQYHAGIAAYATGAFDGASHEEELALCARLWGDVCDEICDRTPPIRTMAGAIAAIKFHHTATEDFARGPDGLQPLLDAVVTFLEGCANG
jgi:hypothetical protein